MDTRNHSGAALAIIVYLLNCSAELGAGQVPSPAAIAIHASQKSLSIVQGSARRSVDLSQLFQGYELNESKLLHASPDAKARYLVVYVAGPSRSPVAAQSFCGAGTEGYLLWLMFDLAWRELKRQLALVESCFESAEGSYEFKAGRLTAVWDNYRQEKRFTLVYDSLTPARGFSITEAKIDASK